MARVGACIATWSYIDAETAILLGELLGVENKAVLAVFHILRQSRTQREVILTAASSLQPRELELLEATLDIHKSIEAERNALAHGIIGVCPDIPDGIIWLPANEQINIRIQPQSSEFEFSRYAELYSKSYVYRDSDLLKLLQDINWLWILWFRVLNHIRQPVEAEYDDISYGARMVQALAQLRQKK